MLSGKFAVRQTPQHILGAVEAETQIECLAEVIIFMPDRSAVGNGILITPEMRNGIADKHQIILIFGCQCAPGGMTFIPVVAVLFYLRTRNAGLRQSHFQLHFLFPVI